MGLAPVQPASAAKTASAAAVEHLRCMGPPGSLHYNATTARKETGMTQVRLTTSRGDINLDLFGEEAPGTVANFLKLVEGGFYDGLAFHRVIPGFVVQGGCPNTREGASGAPGSGGPGWKIRCETEGNPHTHALGALSMAHAGKDTGGSQFFIVNGAREKVAHLDGRHTVFGRCSSDADIEVVLTFRPMDRIERAEVLR
jgi:peptidyl-prolyl cis-trans isomerase B (cyclophilin B)